MDHREALHKVLLSKGCSIWGRPFSIDQFEDRDRCITWILESIVNPMILEKAKSDPGSMWAFNGTIDREPPTASPKGQKALDGGSVGGLTGRPARDHTEGG